MIKIAFAGNPNVGKSALINAIAGSNLTVGNWPGVTVEKKEAEFIYEGEQIKLVDLPGVYSLSPYSLEEKITRDFILEENPDVVINVVGRTVVVTLTMKMKDNDACPPGGETMFSWRTGVNAVIEDVMERGQGC